MLLMSPLFVTAVLSLFWTSEAWIARPQALVSAGSRPTWSSSSALDMAPKYDKATKTWFPTTPDEEPEAGYGPVKTLFLHGPKPYLHRLFQPNDYEQAVLKFMANDKCTREQAQGNMDAYLANPNDWAFNRFREQESGVKVDYWTLEPKDVSLVLVWSSLVAATSGRVGYSLINHVGFWDFL